MKAKFGRYIFLKKLAVGGMAEVYLARRVSFGGFAKFVVIKRLLPEHKGRPAYERLFLAEARNGAILNHPNIASLYDLGKLDDHYFMAMEFVDGISVSDVMARAARTRKPVPLGVALRIAFGVADALYYAHHTADELGEPLRIIHHDITPQNVQAGFGGDVKLLDFGVATRMGQPVSGGRRGKPGYMSPEALKRRPVDARSDLYSLGVVLYELATGRRIGKPHDPTMPLERIERIEIPAPTKLDPYFPPSLEEAILALLAENPEDRPADARLVATTLREIGRKLGFDTGATALSLYLADLMGDELKVHSAHLTELARKSEPARKPEAPKLPLPGSSEPESPAASAQASAEPTPVTAIGGGPAPPEARESTGPRDKLDPALAVQMSGEFDAQDLAFEDPANLPDSPPEAAEPLPPPESLPSATAASTGPKRPSVAQRALIAVALLAAGVGAGRLWSEASARAEARAFGSLEVETRPEGARVFNGDKLLGIAPFLDPRAPVGTPYALRVVLAGHAEFHQEVTLTPERRHRSLTIELKPAP